MPRLLANMSQDSDRSRKRRKTSHACQHCRQHKIKCCGNDPCQSCFTKHLPCIFEARVKKVTISEQYLRELESRASSVQPPSPATSRQQAPSVAPTHECSRRVSSHSDDESLAASRTLVHKASASVHSRNLARGPVITKDYPALGSELQDGTLAEARAPSPIVSNHLSRHEPVADDSQVAVGDTYRHLGHSSSWSFSRRVRRLLGETGNGPELHDSVPIRDGVYGIPWSRPRVNLTGLDLPTPEYAEYLLNTVSYSLGSMYYLFDKARFLEKFNPFYDKRDAGTEQPTGLWLVQMLVVFALGKSLNSREAGPNGPSGRAYFARAIEALPNMHNLYEDPILSIEILCAFALFLQMMDMRLAAYGYVGDAIGICLALGLNRRHDPARISHLEFTHRSKLFWTAYVIDRKLSSLIGVAPKIHDEDIGLSKPSLATSENDNIMAFHVELSSQLGEILNVIYGLGFQRQLGPKFVHAVESILKRLSGISKVLQEKLRLDFETSPDHKTRAVASLQALHCLCTIITIRPVLFFVFERKVTCGHSGRLSDAVRHLFQLGAEAAISIQTIMYELSLHKLIDVLLPFDIDALFTSAFVLVLVDIVAPSGSSWDIDRTFRIMDDMALRGLAVVGPYKQDLVEIVNFREKGSLSNEQQEYSPLPRRELDSTNNTSPETTSAVAAAYGPDQDRTWAGDSRVQMQQQDSLESALEFFSYSFPDISSASEMDPYAWIWDSRLDGGPTH